MNKEEITRKSIFMTGFRSKLTYPFSLEDLEEVEAIIDYYEQKVNQLETNIDEAIEYIKHSWWLRTDQTYDTSKDLKGWEVEELLSLLERGKE